MSLVLYFAGEESYLKWKWAILNIIEI